MRISNLVFSALVALAFGTAEAAPVRRLYQDVALPTQKVIEKQTATAPAAAGTTDILNAFAGPTSTSAVTRTTFVAQPDVPRNIVITPGATTASVTTCNVVVTGTNYFDQTITETFAFTNGTAKTGALAFKTISSVLWPANCELSPYDASWSIGYGAKLGLKRCINGSGDFLAAALNGTRESTFPTVVAGSTNIANNTAALSSSLNGTDVTLYFMQNYGCFP